MAQKYKEKLQELISEGVLNKDEVIRAFMEWVPEDEVQELMEANQFCEPDELEEVEAAAKKSTEVIIFVVDSEDVLEQQLDKHMKKQKLKYKIVNDGWEDGNNVFIVKFEAPKKEVLEFGKDFSYYPFNEEDLTE